MASSGVDDKTLILGQARGRKINSHFFLINPFYNGKKEGYSPSILLDELPGLEDYLRNKKVLVYSSSSRPFVSFYSLEDGDFFCNKFINQWYGPTHEDTDFFITFIDGYGSENFYFDLSDVYKDFASPGRGGRRRNKGSLFFVDYYQKTLEDLLKVLVVDMDLSFVYKDEAIPLKNVDPKSVVRSVGRVMLNYLVHEEKERGKPSWKLGRWFFVEESDPLGYRKSKNYEKYREVLPDVCERFFDHLWVIEGGISKHLPVKIRGKFEFGSGVRSIAINIEMFGKGATEDEVMILPFVPVPVFSEKRGKANLEYIAFYSLPLFISTKTEKVVKDIVIHYFEKASKIKKKVERKHGEGWKRGSLLFDYTEEVQDGEEVESDLDDKKHFGTVFLIKPSDPSGFAPKIEVYDIVKSETRGMVLSAEWGPGQGVSYGKLVRKFDLRKSELQLASVLEEGTSKVSDEEVAMTSLEYGKSLPLLSLYLSNLSSLFCVKLEGGERLVPEISADELEQRLVSLIQKNGDDIAFYSRRVDPLSERYSSIDPVPLYLVDLASKKPEEFVRAIRESSLGIRIVRWFEDIFGNSTYLFYSLLLRKGERYTFLSTNLLPTHSP